jgi:hypothetical protein
MYDVSYGQTVAAPETPAEAANAGPDLSDEYMQPTIKDMADSLRAIDVPRQQAIAEPGAGPGSENFIG